ncbi:universal stress protein [Nocardia sp. NEAU-G5]|uniref:Universal stress protein n=1 Tax=Nocardia albiluteola TaxID=2842303 RepID=A0ABS6AWI1_9NOCA|nr:universal stress protein [Nocardia albiluteola]MBU3062387.1 universal stress protein [Nocardia albiluteola]
MTEHLDSTRREPNPPILAAVDGSAASYKAATWAATDAALHGCGLHLVTSVSVPAGYGPGAMLTGTDTDWLQVEGERIVTEATRIVRAAMPGAEPPVTTEVSWSPDIPDLIERSRRVRTLALGSSGAGALRRGLVGSVTSAMVRHAHCPVAVIHYEQAADPMEVIQPVVVGVDGSPNSVPALVAAFEEASLRKVGLTAVHAWADTAVSYLSMDWENAMRENEDMVLAESMAGWSERYPEVPVRRVVVRDRPVRALLEEAHGAQLVVVGSHGRGGFTGMLLGATSNALVHTVECPILVVRHGTGH